MKKKKQTTATAGLTREVKKRYDVLYMKPTYEEKKRKR